MSRHGSIAGFTLLELLVVLAIGGLLVGLSGPMYSAAVPGARLRADVRALVVELQDAANQAVSTSREVDMRFAPEAASYAAASGEAVSLSRGSRLEVNSSFYVVDGRDADTVARDDSQKTLRFYPDGSSSGAAIIIRNSNRGYRIGVDWLTGRVAVLEWADENG